MRHWFSASALSFSGTFWLTFGGCGTAVLAAAFPEHGIGFAGVALAFGLTVLTWRLCARTDLRRPFQSRGDGRPLGRRPLLRRRASYLTSSRRSPARSWRRRCFTSSPAGKPGFELGGFASNGYGDLSPGHYSLLSCLVTEVLLTFFFILIIHGATSPFAPAGFAGLAIGLALTLIHLISIPVTNTSVNPARSTGPALVRRRPVYRAALAVLACADRGRHSGGLRLPLALQRSRAEPEPPQAAAAARLKKLWPAEPCVRQAISLLIGRAQATPSLDNRCKLGLWELQTKAGPEQWAIRPV